MINNTDTPRILIFDIENSPILGYTWGIWEQNVIEIVKPWYLLCFAYRWYGEDEVHTVALTDFKEQYAKDPTDDFSVTVAIHKLLDEADIVIAHNGDQFDIRKVMARIATHNLTPPSKFLSIDTKKVAKKYFAFESNSLKDLAKQFNVEQKGETGGFSLWKKCMAGDMEAWAKMIEYNKQDVVVLTDIYERLRPFIQTHPNVSLIDAISCPKCASTHLQSRGYSITKTGLRYQRFQCQSCGGWSQNRTLETKPITT